MNDKRAHERTDVRLNALFRKDDSYIFRTKVINISMGGLFMETSQFMKPGTNISVDIDAENIGQIIGVHGHVVRNTGSGLAVEFASVDNSILDRLIEREKYMSIKKKQTIEQPCSSGYSF
ncbi:MAG TPA: PilZ domain-containing protein [Desulfomonilia bacterium]